MKNENLIIINKSSYLIQEKDFLY